MTHKIEIIFILFSFLGFTLTPYSVIKWSAGPQVDNELPLVVEEQLQKLWICNASNFVKQKSARYPDVVQKLM